MPFDVSSGLEYNLLTTKMKDWDIVSNNKGYLKFKNISKNNDSSKLPGNETFLSNNGNGISQATPENGNPPPATTNGTSSRSTDQEKLNEYQLLNLSDSNILKSVRTYAKKKESTLSVFYDKLDSDTEKTAKSSKHDNKYFSKKIYPKTYTDKSVPSSLLNGVFENGNGRVDLPVNLNNSSANGLSSDLKVDIFTDHGIFSLYDSPNELECSSFNADDRAFNTFSNGVASNGYQRTRKNLKNHLVEQKKLDYVSEDDTSEVKMNHPDMTLNKANTLRKTQISPPPFLANGSYKKPKIEKNCKVDPQVSSVEHSKILKTPKVSTEKVQNNSSSINMNTTKKQFSLLEVVQRLSVKFQKQLSETSLEASKVTVNSKEKDCFAALSPSENNSYFRKCNSPEYISSKKSNFKRDKIAKRTNYLSNGKAKDLNNGKAENKSPTSKYGLLINEKPLCDSIGIKPETSPSPKHDGFTALPPPENNGCINTCNSPEYISSKKSNLKRNKIAKKTKYLSNGKAKDLSNGKAESKSPTSKYGLLINEKPLCDSIGIKPETSPSPKNDDFTALSPPENNSCINTCNSPEYISSKKSNLKRDKVTIRTKTLSYGKAESESPSLKHGCLVNKKQLCDSISHKSNSADSLGLLNKINVGEELKHGINHTCNFLDHFPSHLSVSKKHHPDIPLSRTIGKKRSISYDGGLDIVKRPRVNLTFDATDTANRHSLGRSNERTSRSPTKNSFINGAPHKSCTNSKMSTAPVQNVSEQGSFTLLQKADNAHICSKTKLLHVPVIVCDCSDSNPAKNSNSLIPSLAAHVNNFASTVVNIVKRNPENIQLLSYNHYKTFCDSIQRVFLQTNVENSCDLFDLHPSVTTNHLSIAKPFKGDPVFDANNDDNQCQAFINSAFIFSKHCTYKMINSFITNLDVCELQFTVKHFCSSPKVVQFMSEFFSGCDRFPPTSVSERKFQFEFPKHYEKDPLCSVVKEYTRLFVHKIWPLGSKTLASQSVMEFAYKNMSTTEISIMSYFFHSNELFTLKAFVPRFTYVAVLAIYKFYGRIN